MYSDIIKRFSELTHRELTALSLAISAEIRYREGLEPIAWECPGCDFSAPSWAEVVNHAQKEHSLESATKGYSKGYGIAYPPKEIWP